MSGIALDLLDELRTRVIECRLVLQALQEEADLNLDELDRDLDAAQQAAQVAHEAASLVHQGARLNERWGTGWSRPKAIFARHGAAVIEGAHKVNPNPMLSERLHRSMWQLPAPERVEATIGARPRCSAAVRATSLRCTVSAIYLGHGLFAAHCYSHATPAERDQYRQRTDAIADAQHGATDRLLQVRREVGENVAKRWRQHHETRLQWIDQIDAALHAQTGKQPAD